MCIRDRSQEDVQRGRRRFACRSAATESGERIPKKLASLGFGRRATPAQKTQVVQKLRQKYSLEILLSIAQLPKATFYYHLKKSIQPDKYQENKDVITAIYHENKGRYGYRRITVELHNRNIPLNHKTVQRLKMCIRDRDMGHKRLALETGEDPVRCPIDYVLESIDTIYHIKHKNGAIRRVNVNIAATTVENYSKLKAAGIGTYILFQETYNKDCLLYTSRCV